MDMENLTPAQKELIDYLQDEIANSQLSPAELAAKKANEEQEELMLM
tara:strand:+ start:3391 stop:3531 length:141 start_codon:yes stop_codon:yes gene_type:complete